MNGHFRAFSFVDRITALKPGSCIRGQYTIPAGVDIFPVSLVSEAVGQLAAWGAMAAVDFSHRPVAGIASAIELVSAVRPGQVLDLSAELASVDTEAVEYCGEASVNGSPVVRLVNCVGPMVPAKEFDDPEELRKRFELLREEGATPGAFEGIPRLDVQCSGGEQGESARATLSVPEGVPFFTDHFPRRPVFPGTLLMHAKLQVAEKLAKELSSGNGHTWIPRTLSDIKLRAFIPPGEKLSIEAKRTEDSGDNLSVTVQSRIEKRLVSSAEISFVREVRS